MDFKVTFIWSVFLYYLPLFTKSNLIKFPTITPVKLSGNTTFLCLVMNIFQCQYETIKFSNDLIQIDAIYVWSYAIYMQNYDTN